MTNRMLIMVCVVAILPIPLTIKAAIYTAWLAALGALSLAEKHRAKQEQLEIDRRAARRRLCVATGEYINKHFDDEKDWWK